MTSRPSSRASQPTRPSSSLSSTAGIPRNVSATPSHKFGGLSEKQLSKISLNIASARKSTTDLRHKAGLSSAIVKEDEPLASSKPAATAKINNNAFIHSAAFSEAPLKSRVPPASPRRDMLKTPKPDRTASALAKPEELPMLRGTSLEIQEALLIEDLLFVLMVRSHASYLTRVLMLAKGVEGQYIAFHEDYSPEDEADRLKGARFVVDEEMDASLRHLVERVLPVATYYTAIDTFVEQHSHLEYGLINHALCAAIRDVTREYLVLVAQLEHLFQTAPTFTLRQFWLYIQESLDKLSLTYTLVQDLLAAPEEAVESEAEEDSDSDLSDASGPGAEGVKALLKQMKASGSTKALSAWKQGGIVKGGEVLCVIEEHLQQSAGNPSAVALYSTLLLKASQPYMATLLKWIGSGRLSDPHDEFMIRETKSITRGSLEMDYVDEYWERRYTLKDQPVVASTSEPLPETVIPERPTSALSGRKAAREKGLGGGGVIPSFLEPLKAKILLAGKYLNVIRECGIGIQIPQEVIDGLGQRLIAMHDPGCVFCLSALMLGADSLPDSMIE
jgi:gamma-tubulin complex component 2